MRQKSRSGREKSSLERVPRYQGHWPIIRARRSTEEVQRFDQVRAMRVAMSGTKRVARWGKGGRARARIWVKGRAR